MTKRRNESFRSCHRTKNTKTRLGHLLCRLQNQPNSSSCIRKSEAQPEQSLNPNLIRVRVAHARVLEYFTLHFRLLYQNDVQIFQQQCFRHRSADMRMRGQQDCTRAAMEVGAGVVAACPTEMRGGKGFLSYSTQKEATIHPFLALRLTTESPAAAKPAYNEMLKTREKFNCQSTRRGPECNGAPFTTLRLMHAVPRRFWIRVMSAEFQYIRTVQRAISYSRGILDT